MTGTRCRSRCWAERSVRCERDAGHVESHQGQGWQWTRHVAGSRRAR